MRSNVTKLQEKESLVKFEITEPNFSQTPNVIIDEWLPYLTGLEFKVLMLIVRKTFGWHKTRDRISNSQISKITGSPEAKIRAVAKNLHEKGIIRKEVVGPKGNEQTFYELIIAYKEKDSNNLDGVPKGPSPGSQRDPTKETLTKEKKTTTIPPTLPKKNGDASMSKQAASPEAVASGGGSFSKEKKEKKASPRPKSVSQPPDPEKLKTMNGFGFSDDDLSRFSTLHSLESLRIASDYLKQIIDKGEKISRSRASVFVWAAKNPEQALESLGRGASEAEQEKRKEIVKSFYAFNYGLTQKGCKGYAISTTPTSVVIYDGKADYIADISDSDFYKRIDYIRQKTGK